MAWSSRLRPGDSRTTRAIATRHCWQFVNKRSDADSFDGVSRWFCSHCDAERESWTRAKPDRFGHHNNQSRYRACKDAPWRSKCPTCERKAVA